MKRTPHLNHLVGLSAAALLVLSVSGFALPTLRLSDGMGNSVIIGDGSPGDSATTSGLVTYTNFFDGQLSITAGISKPAIGSSTTPILTLNDVTVFGGSGTLIIDFSDTDFGPLSTSTLFASIGGTTNSSVSYLTYYSEANDLFGMAHLVTNQPNFIGVAPSNSFGGALGNGNATGFLPILNSFSLTQRVIIQRNGGQDNTGFTATVSAAPVPDGGSTVTLLGLSMFAMAGAIRLGSTRRAERQG